MFRQVVIPLPGAPVTSRKPRDTRTRNRLFFGVVLAALMVGFWLVR